ncbi:hypothetical protein E4U54_008247 [Claviceps lovelessii]|nr:hypothetical protein E4U54_008247 [Claviceps lovelessii]
MHAPEQYQSVATVKCCLVLIWTPLLIAQEHPASSASHPPDTLTSHGKHFKISSGTNKDNIATCSTPTSRSTLAATSATLSRRHSHGFPKKVSCRTNLLAKSVFADHRTSKEVLAVILAWAVTFTAVCTLILCLGFGPVGIGAGTLAAAFQSYMYGGFTPAGGIFATLTSIGMLGMLMPAAALLAAMIATGVAVAVWAWGVGR